MKLSAIQLLFLLCFTVNSIAQQKYPPTLVVAQDGTGNYKTIQEAVNSVRDLGKQVVKIFIKKGIYHEKIVIPSWKTNISLIGEDAANTIITNQDYSGKSYPAGKDSDGLDKFSTYTSYTLLVQGDGFTAQNLTIQNTSGRVGQAVALHVEADQVIVRNCRILGNQDTLYAATGTSRQYYLDCYIEGTTDFIFGEATAVFQSCTVKSLSDSYITAAATTDGQKFGFVFFDCKIIAANNVRKVFLGRPWRPYAKTVFIRTEMGEHILKEGWHAWAGDAMFPDKGKTAYYAEFKSSGLGGVTAGRVAWSKQLTNSEVNYYTLKNIFAGNHGSWDPAASTGWAQNKVPILKDSIVPSYVSKVWVADQGNGTYKNPVLDADYSDPDAIRVGDDFYMVASSFDAVPGLPILHSKDLVNWTLINHALKRQPPFEHFSKTQHGNGVWAPAIRFYKGEFYIYYPDPDFGIYVTKAKNPTDEWSEPILIEGGKGLIDPCPFWDDDGRVYLAYAFAGSRAGIKSVIAVKQLNPEGTKTMDAGVLVYDGHELDPTIEGPKFYKRNGYYYIFAPAGGVATGWQLVLRSKNIYGPYERKVVMDQGKTIVNGPHQGAWVNTPTGEDWFLHFQDKDAYGRVVHLQPMKWINDWPVIGIDKDGDGIGEPVMTYKKPDVGRVYPVQTPPESDEFNSAKIGLQWQWQANPRATWSFMNVKQGSLRLYSQQVPDDAKSLWEVPNILMQKFPTEQFTATVKLTFSPNTKIENEKAGIVVMGQDYASLTIKSKKDGNYLVYSLCKGANKGNEEVETPLTKLMGTTLYLRVTVAKEAKCKFSYSTDGQNFVNGSKEFQATAGQWIGAKIGLFCTRDAKINDSGYADFDWFRVN